MLEISHRCKVNRVWVSLEWQFSGRPPLLLASSFDLQNLSDDDHQILWSGFPCASSHCYILTVSHLGLIQRPILLLADTTFTDSFDFWNSSGIIYVKYFIFSTINGDDLIIGIRLLMILSHDDLGSQWMSLHIERIYPISSEVILAKELMRNGWNTKNLTSRTQTPSKPYR